MSNYYAPCFCKIDFVVIHSYIELPCTYVETRQLVFTSKKFEKHLWKSDILSEDVRKQAKIGENTTSVLKCYFSRYINTLVHRKINLLLICNHSLGTKYSSRMAQVNLSQRTFKKFEGVWSGCLPQILLAPFLSTLSHLVFSSLEIQRRLIQAKVHYKFFFYCQKRND